MDNLLKIIYTLGRHIKDEITIRQVSKESKVPYTTTYRTVQENKGLIRINEKANLKLCSLNLKDRIIKHYLIISERAQFKEFVKKNHLFSLFRKDLPEEDYSVVLFGSRAESKERKKSDVDVCVIGGKRIRFSKFELLSKLEVNPVYLSKKEFLAMFKEEDHNLAKEILRKHIVLYGADYFWSVILDGI